jgi:hypothetical protein
VNDTPELPSFLQYDQSGFWTYQAELTVKFQSKVFRVLRILLTQPTIVVMKEIR